MQTIEKTVAEKFEVFGIEITKCDRNLILKIAQKGGTANVTSHNHPELVQLINKGIIKKSFSYIDFPQIAVGHEFQFRIEQLVEMNEKTMIEYKSVTLTDFGKKVAKIIEE